MEKEAAATEILLPFWIVCLKSSTTFLLTLSRTSGLLDSVGVVFANNPIFLLVIL